VLSLQVFAEEEGHDYVIEGAYLKGPGHREPTDDGQEIISLDQAGDWVPDTDRLK